MKFALSLIVVVLSFSSICSAQFTPEQRYQAYKYMIVDTTEIRIAAARAGDTATVCDAKEGRAETDTMVYYISFEALTEPFDEIAQRMAEEVGYFTFRNYVSIFKRGLAQDLHHACMSGDDDKIIEAALALEGEMSLETPF